ncbi:MAG: hypothetical protein ABUS79_13370 [Pseudomonadota bacterium]
MELSDLNTDERTALVGLIKAVVLSDGKVSQDEIEEVEEVVQAFGEDTYQKALDSFEARFPTQEAFQTFLRTIHRPEARDLIYGTILQGAAADAIEGGESELLTWLATAWDIEVTTEEPSDDELGGQDAEDPEDPEDR